MAHSHQTENRIPCEIMGCSKDFARVADMRRHVHEVHGGPKFCPEPDCNWRGAKRDDRLEDHKVKAHPEIYTEILLDVPENFGTPSPRILPQVPQQEGLTGGATITSYSGLGGGSGLNAPYPNSSVPEAHYFSSGAPNDPGVLNRALSGGNGLVPAPWDLPMPNDQANFLSGYQSHSVLTEELPPTSLHPSLIYTNTPETIEGVTTGVSGTRRQGPGSGNMQNDRGQRSWS